MLITRHNYEEFFLLYADNELGADARLCVEAFVQENPDLASELQLLQELKLVPDATLHFGNKQSLLKAELLATEGINESNYEGYLLLYADAELDATDRARVEKFVQQNPAVAKELQLLQSARMEPDTSVVFANKEILNREPARVVGFGWKRMAAAAAVLLLISLGWWMLSNRSNVPANNIAAGEKQNQPADKDAQQAVTQNDNPANNNDPSATAVVNPAAEASQKEQQRVEEIYREAVEGNNPEKSLVNNTAISGNSGKGSESADAGMKPLMAATHTPGIIKSGNGEEKTVETIVSNKLPETSLPVIAEEAPPARNENSIAMFAVSRNNEEETKQRKGLFPGIRRKLNRMRAKNEHIDPDDRSVRIAALNIPLKRNR
jgi:anti-sigma factor RsiW